MVIKPQMKQKKNEKTEISGILDEGCKVTVHQAWSGSGVAEGLFLLLSADGAACVGWLVSYLPWPTDIHRGPTPFGTLKSFFSCTGWEKSAWVDHEGLRHGCHMASFYPLWSLSLWDAQPLNAHMRFLKYALWQRHFGSLCCCLSRHITETHLHFFQHWQGDCGCKCI